MQNYSVAQLKRDAKEGKLRAFMTVRGGTAVDQERLPEWIKGYRKIVGANSNSLLFENPADPSKPSYLDLPKASLIEYTDQHLRIYYPGHRAPTQEEQKVLTAWKAIESTEQYQKQLEADCLSDGSSTYYQQLAFFQKHNMEYLFGRKQRGMVIDYNKRNAGEAAYIQDENVRGSLCMEYQLEREKEFGAFPDKKLSIDAQIQGAVKKAESLKKDEPQKTSDLTR